MTEEHMQNNESNAQSVTIDRLSNINVELSIEIGKAKLTLSEVMALKAGDVVALNKLNTDPFDIKVNDKKVAQGQIVISENQYYIKVTKILDKVNHG